MIKFVGFRAKSYSYLIDDSSEDKTANGTQKVCHKKTLNLEFLKIVCKQLKLRIK